MAQEIIFSILTPAVPSRWETTGNLQEYLAAHIGERPVEHLVLCDNKRRTVGEKRDNLLRLARGKYVAFVDDDDYVSDDYVHELLKAARKNPDVITFRQIAEVDAQWAEVEFKLGNPNEEWKPGGLVRRNAWHVCAWRRELAILSCFPAINYGEDWAYASRLCGLSGLTEVHIPKVLHYYNHSSKTTEAPCPLPA